MWYHTFEKCAYCFENVKDLRNVPKRLKKQFRKLPEFANATGPGLQRWQEMQMTWNTSDCSEDSRTVHKECDDALYCLGIF